MSTTAAVRFERISTKGGGRYWRTKAGSALPHGRDYIHGPRFKISEASAGAKTRDKVAESPNNNSESGFEQAFSSLGYAYLKDKAPRLLDFLVGFQLVDRNEDNTKAMAVFGFRVGKQWLYAPVFFLNGDLKGHELLYIKNQDTFVPMKENWVNYLMNRQPHVLGENSEEDAYQLGGMQPDIRRMSLSPSSGFGKRGVDDWAKPVLPFLAAARVKAGRSLFAAAKAGTKLAFDAVVQNPQKAAMVELADRIDLNRVLPQSFTMLKAAWDIAQAFPGVYAGFKKFYGADCFSRWGKEVQAAAKSKRLSVLPKPPVKQAQVRRTGIGLIQDKPLPPHPIKSGALEIHVYEDVATGKSKPELTDAERSKLLHDTVLIKDKRDPHQTSVAYNTQVEQRLINPDATGLFSVLEKPGSFERMLVLFHPYSAKGHEDFATVIRLGEGKKDWLNSHPSNVWTNQAEEKAEFNDWFDKLGKGSLEKGGLYVAITPDGCATVPFEVDQANDGVYTVSLNAHCRYSEERSVMLPRRQRDQDPYVGRVSNYGVKMFVDAEHKQGTAIRAIQGDLRIPGSAKFLKLADPPKPQSSRNECCIMPVEETSASEDRPIQLGKLDDIQVLFTEKTARLKIYDDHSEVSITTAHAGVQRLTKFAALISLVRDHGLSEAAAREMLKRAAARTSEVYRIDYAPGFGPRVKEASPNNSMLEGGPRAPFMLPPEIGYESYGGRAGSRTQEPHEQYNPVPELDSSMTDPNVYNIWQNYTHEDFQNQMGQAQQAAQDGQKEVFDTSMISGMLKAVRQDSLVDRHLGDLMQALDKLGRILLLFYWHGEEFEDRYGKQDLPELEDGLRNSFESLGDITLFLKEKTVNTDMTEMGDPDIEETARN
jgi:hypothetical protein